MLTHRSTATACAILAVLALTTGPTFAAKTEGVGSGLSVTQSGSFGVHRLSWMLKGSSPENPRATLFETEKPCDTLNAPKLTELKKGGNLVAVMESSGRTHLVVDGYCLGVDGDWAAALSAMGQHTTTQLIPLENQAKFTDRVPFLRKLLAWHRSPLDEARAPFSVGALAPARDYPTVTAILDVLQPRATEAVEGLSPFGASVTLYNPQAVPMLDVLHLSVARSGQDVKVTQVLAVSESTADEWAAALDSLMGPPARAEWRGPVVTYFWPRGEQEFSVESIGNRSRLLWRDMSCHKVACNPPVMPDIR